MARTKQHRPQHPSSVRVRRAAHLAHDAEVKARKRNPTAGERARQRIRAAKLAGSTFTITRPGGSKMTFPYGVTQRDVDVAYDQTSATRTVVVHPLEERRRQLVGDSPSGFLIGPARVFITPIDGEYVELTRRYAVGPFVCAQKKVEQGWAIVDEPRDAVVAYEGSRSKARARRDRLNAGEERVEL